MGDIKCTIDDMYKGIELMKEAMLKYAYSDILRAGRAYIRDSSRYNYRRFRNAIDSYKLKDSLELWVDKDMCDKCYTNAIQTLCAECGHRNDKYELEDIIVWIKSRWGRPAENGDL